MIYRTGVGMCNSEPSGLSEGRERAVRAELQRLLESAGFRTSKRCRDFLEYVVEHTIRGPAGALKERSIGVALFNLPPDFDPGQHATVRVTANEIRKKLAQHYLAENGAPPPVKIDLPPGSYRAAFTWAAPLPETAPLQPSSSRVGMILACGAAIVVIGLGLSAWSWLAADPPSADATSNTIAVPPAAAAGDGEETRILVGSSTAYVDRSGRYWGADRHFSGGSVFFRPSEKIARTLDPDIYRRFRHGDFRYDIPLKAGSYELHLHFAETALSDSISAESSGQGQRYFKVSANGRPILDTFDVASDSFGVNNADERVFRDISPADDGFLYLAFESLKGTAILSAIEVLPVSSGQVRPVRIRAGWPSSWRDSAGRLWQADSYFIEGNALVRRTNPAQESDSRQGDLSLYASERWGHFSYAVPAADGLYRVTLRFCEGDHGARSARGGGVGSRLFDVYCNGTALLRNFDIFKEAGGEGRPVDRTFSGIRPTAQGKILLNFVPVKGTASVNGIEIVGISR